ncbi:MAG: aminotransferase class I/II-fold pyridoxal phosphate-dependent enzyme [Bacteriovoracaceae bacterium]
MWENEFSKNRDKYQPETLSLNLGYDASLSEGSVKVPIFMTSTFEFKSAEDGKRFFEYAYGLKERGVKEDPGLIYSRINNPNLQIFEERIAAWDGTDKGAVFSSGMSAITTTLLALLNPGDVIFASSPVYGGTYYFFTHMLPKFGIEVVNYVSDENIAEKMEKDLTGKYKDKVKMIFLETPANPSNVLVDIESVTQLKKHNKDLIVAVDNTFLGPVFQKPADFGADLIIYSATKFIGGHSDLIAGVVTGPNKLMEMIGGYRTILGTMANPFTGWLLLRSLETLSIRMERQAKNAIELAKLLKAHKNVEKVTYPALLEKGDPQKTIFDKQCKGFGAVIAFDIKGGEKEAFKVLDHFKVFRLAVSLGGTESLVEHPMRMTHSDVPPEHLSIIGVKESTIRISVGIEHVDDLKADINNALSLLD